MSRTTLAHAPTPTDDQIDRILDAAADAFVHQLRSPIMHTPSEQNLAYAELPPAASSSLATSSARCGTFAIGAIRET
jgi:hypothetical protein